MKLRITTLVLALSALAATTCGATKTLTLEDIYLSDKFNGDYLNQPQWQADGASFAFLKADDSDGIISIWKHDADTGDETILLDGHHLMRPGSRAPISIDEYCLSDDGTKILIHTDTASVWRHSQLGKCFVYNLSDGSVMSVYEGEESLANVKLSPDGSHVGFVLNNDIYTLELATGNNCRWTFDGSENIINGAFDWAYEEEFGIADGWMWSPDSKKIAFWRLDQSGVPPFSWIDYNSVHQEITTIRYPKAGDPVSVPQVGVIDMEKDTTVWMDIGQELDVYIPSIAWTNNSDTLSIQWLNRAQNQLELLLAEVHTGQADIVLTETDSCYVDIWDNLLFLENKNQFLWTSEADGFNHIYIYSNSGRLIRQVTSGEWDVGEVFGIDEANGVIYFSSRKDLYIESHVYAVSVDGGEVKRLTVEPGWHNAEFSDDFRYFIDKYSDASTPPKAALRDGNGALVRMLKENDIATLKEYNLSYPEFFSIETEDAAVLEAYMMKPADFDESKKYPVMVYCYGGPYGQSVSNSWYKDWGTRSLLMKNYLLQHGYLIFTVDNRGVGGYGKTDRNLVYGDLGKWAVHDQIQGAKYLASLPYVDKDRIGITGGSFGGYLTLLAMTVGADHFKVGVAHAPVTAWRLYDAIYTERFMMKPDENPDGYRAASVFTHIDSLKGKLLLIHGMCDDNVHVQNTMQLAERLQIMGKSFQMMVYPSQPHSFSCRQRKYHQAVTTSEFILENL